MSQNLTIISAQEIDLKSSCSVNQTTVIQKLHATINQTTVIQKLHATKYQTTVTQKSHATKYQTTVTQTLHPTTSNLKPQTEFEFTRNVEIHHEAIMKNMIQTFDLDYNISIMSAEEDEAMKNELLYLGLTEKDGEISSLTKINAAISSSMNKHGYQFEFQKEKFEQLMNPRKSFIVHCTFAGKACETEKDFAASYQSKFGVCFSFNYANSTKYMIDESTVNKGLSLMINNNPEENLLTTSSGGIKILLHETDEYPFVDSFGQFIPVGSDAVLLGGLTLATRTPTNKNSCSKHFNASWSLYDEHSYSYEGCIRSLQQIAIMDNCKCYNPDFATGANETKLLDCTYNDACMAFALNQLNAQTEKIKCSIECRKMYFQTETSFSTLRQQSMQPHGFDSTSAIRLTVKLKSVMIVAISERAAMQLEDVFWAVCNTAGLFMGISMLEIFALVTSAVQFVFELVTRVVNRRKIACKNKDELY